MPRFLRRPDAAHLLLAAAAVVTGCLLLLSLGAPLRMPLINLAALLIGFAVLALLDLVRRAGTGRRLADVGLIFVALTVPATALLGVASEGISRWIVVGGLTLQPAAIAIPVVSVGLALRQSASAVAAAVIAAVGVAMQPDPGSATMLLLGTAAPLIRRVRSPGALVAAAAAGVACVLAWLRAPLLPPIRFVEGVIADALAHGPLSAILLLLGLLLALAPAIRGGRLSTVTLAFAGVWIGAFAASLTGAYPTPILGFGGSAILGYVLSLGLTLQRTAAGAANRSPAAPSADNEEPDTFRFA